MRDEEEDNFVCFIFIFGAKSRNLFVQLQPCIHHDRSLDKFIIICFIHFFTLPQHFHSQFRSFVRFVVALTKMMSLHVSRRRKEN